jgi:hypothetical protein
MAAVAVTTFLILIQVPIDVLRFVFVRVWTRCGCVWTVSNLLSECSRSPLLERCGESAHFGKRAALRAEAVDRVNAKSVQAMNKLNFPAALKSRASNRTHDYSTPSSHPFRPQAEVDARRAMAGLADAVAAATFDAQAAADAAAVRVRSAERLRDAVTKALGDLHAMLDPEQRARLAYLIRTGTLQV